MHRPSFFMNDKTKGDGKQYSTMIQKLPYIILAEQIPPANMCTTIKAVLTF